MKGVPLSYKIALLEQLHEKPVVLSVQDLQYCFGILNKEHRKHGKILEILNKASGKNETRFDLTKYDEAIVFQVAIGILREQREEDMWELKKKDDAIHQLQMELKMQAIELQKLENENKKLAAEAQSYKRARDSIVHDVNMSNGKRHEDFNEVRRETRNDLDNVCKKQRVDSEPFQYWYRESMRKIREVI